MKKTTVLVITLLTFCITKGESAPLKCAIHAPSAILINADNGRIIFEKNAYSKRPVASITKMATLLEIAQKNPDLDEVIICPLDCLVKIPKKIKIERGYQDPPYRLEPDGRSYGICAGEQLRIKDLIYGMMLKSANDAANVLAYHLGKGIDAFMKEVNQQIQKIGCKNTVFFNPHGLHYPHHASTAYDLALITREGLKYPLFEEVLKTVAYERPKTNKQPAWEIQTGNRFAKPGSNYDARIVGGKVGFTENAGYCFLGLAEDNGRRLISVVLGCESYNIAFADTKKIVQIAFAESLVHRQLINKDDYVLTKSVKMFNIDVKARLQEHVYIEYYPSEEIEIQPVVEWNELQFPIIKDQNVGQIKVVTLDGQVIKTCCMYATHDYPLTIGMKIKLWTNSHKGLATLLFFAIFGAVITSFLLGWRYLHRYFLSKSEKACSTV